jgi:copper homeostasis protein
MPGRYLLEISVETVEAAAAAERGGAERIELCADLSVGGLTPSAELLLAAREKIRLPIRSMVRPRGGDFVYTAGEFRSMQRDIDLARRLRMDGVVLGILTADRRVDIERTRQLVDLARPLPTTFHRAFDECPDLEQALEDVILTGSACLLTSGGARTAAEGSGTLCKLVQLAGDRIVILPGAGTNSVNIRKLVRETHAREFHSGLSSSLPRPHTDYARFESEVAKLAEILAEDSLAG